MSAQRYGLGSYCMWFYIWICTLIVLCWLQSSKRALHISVKWQCGDTGDVMSLLPLLILMNRLQSICAFQNLYWTLTVNPPSTNPWATSIVQRVRQENKERGKIRTIWQRNKVKGWFITCFPVSRVKIMRLNTFNLWENIRDEHSSQCNIF